MAVSRILSTDFSAGMIIYLISNFSERPMDVFGGHRPPLQFIVMRRYPRINGPAALPLFCLAPHGVFPASRIAPWAV